MSNKLKAITTKAKVLYKTGKYAKWTDAIKAAAKTLPATKKKAKVGAVKKAAPKKKAATKKPTSIHKDSKSHNVKISVVSGTEKIQKARINALELYKDIYSFLASDLIMETRPKVKAELRKEIKRVKAIIAVLKK